MATKVAAAALLALTAPAAMAAPVPGKLQTYTDWTVACDNGGACEAVSLIPANGAFDGPVLMLGLERAGGPAAQPAMWASTDDDALSGPVDFLVDGRKVAGAIAGRGEARVEGPQAAALANAVARGAVLEVRQRGRLVGRPSIAGSAAAFRHIDAQQGRAGTVTAILATGPLPAQAVRAAPALPAVSRAPIAPNLKYAGLWREELARAAGLSGCADTMEGRAAEVHPLDRERALVLVPCGAGAYNASSVPLIATGGAGRRSFAFARFDHQPGWSADADQPMLVNAGWNEAGGELSSYAKGRGLGDCGSAETYVWDGAMFRMTEATAMGECRGARHWLRLWRAKASLAK
jgi:hypothetical protein